MKKFLSIITFLFAICLSVCVCESCGKKSENKQQVEEVAMTIGNFNTVLQQNYKSVKDTFPAVKYYESQVIFNNPVSTDTVLELESVINVFQAGEYSYQFVYKADTSYITKVHNYWLEDCAIEPEKVITLDSALTCLKKSNIVKPASKMVTLRKPLGPTSNIDNPGYFFGDSHHKPFIKVDAVDGSVKQFE